MKTIKIKINNKILEEKVKEWYQKPSRGCGVHKNIKKYNRKNKHIKSYER